MIGCLWMAWLWLMPAPSGSAEEHREAPAAESTPFPFRGWEACYRLTNGDTEVILVPEAGARILVFSWKGANVLLVDEQASGKTLRGEQHWMPWDGSAPDTMSPEGGSQLAHLWLGRYEVTRASPRSLQCRSRDNRRAGLRVEKEFQLDSREPVLTITRTLTNLQDRPATWSFWERTLVPGRAVALAPVAPASADGPRGYARRVGKEFQTPPEAEANPRVVQGLLILRAEGKGAAIGLDNRPGWTAALVDDLLFTLRFPVWPERSYPWNAHRTQVCFYAANRIELEPASPWFELGPGAQQSWTLQWHLAPFGDRPGTDQELAERARSLIERNVSRLRQEGAEPSEPGTAPIP